MSNNYDCNFIAQVLGTSITVFSVNVSNELVASSKSESRAACKVLEQFLFFASDHLKFLYAFSDDGFTDQKVFITNSSRFAIFAAFFTFLKFILFICPNISRYGVIWQKSARDIVGDRCHDANCVF